MYHLSYDIADGSKITTNKVIQLICGQLSCKILRHNVKSTFIFESDKELTYISNCIQKEFPSEFYYELSEIKEQKYEGKCNPECDDTCTEQCNMYRINSKIN